MTISSRPDPAALVRLLWETEPWVRCELQESDDLDGWELVPGYSAAADALVKFHFSAPVTRGLKTVLTGG